MVQDGLLYYLSERDEEVQPRLYLPKLIREDLLKQIHDDMGHMGVDKIYELIGRKCFWPGLYKEVTNYIEKGSIKTSESKINSQTINVPEEHRKKIEDLIQNGRDVIANSNKELGQTQAVQIKINTGKNGLERSVVVIVVKNLHKEL